MSPTSNDWGRAFGWAGKFQATQLGSPVWTPQTLAVKHLSFPATQDFAVSILAIFVCAFLLACSANASRMHIGRTPQMIIIGSKHTSP